MNIVCYGDSNTWGHNPLNGNRFIKNERWPGILQGIMKSDNIIEEGLCGRCASFLDTVKPYRHAISSLRMIMDSHQPIDIIIMMLGTNDLKACFNPNAIAITSGIKEMLHTLQNPAFYNVHMKPPKVLLIAPPHIHECYKGIERTKEQFNQQSLEVSHKLASYYQELADACHCYFLDASLYAQASTIDGVHMDTENHQALAEAIYKKINSIY